MGGLKRIYLTMCGNLSASHHRYTSLQEISRKRSLRSTAGRSISRHGHVRTAPSLAGYSPSFPSFKSSLPSLSLATVSARAAGASIISAASNGSGSDSAGEDLTPTVAVAGATGLIGTRLVEMFIAQGYKVNVLTRNPASAKAKLETVPGANARTLAIAGPTQWKSAMRGCSAVINMAGEPIATRWSSDLKEEIKRSRVSTTKRIVEALNSLAPGERPEVLVNASAVGYYGTSETATFNEESSSGDDYLAEVCREWEAAAMGADCRVVVLRTGIVLAKEGGALAKMVPVFQMFAGGPLGSGKQWFSWIHRDDVVGMILQGVEDSTWSGVYNGVAPNPVRMGELCSALGDVMQRPSFVPVPDFALQTLLGEGAKVVLEGQRVLPTRAKAGGYQFKFDKVGPALENIIKS